MSFSRSSRKVLSSQGWTSLQISLIRPLECRTISTLACSVSDRVMLHSTFPSQCQEPPQPSQPLSSPSFESTCTARVLSPATPRPLSTDTHRLSVKRAKARLQGLDFVFTSSMSCCTSRISLVSSCELTTSASPGARQGSSARPAHMHGPAPPPFRAQPGRNRFHNALVTGSDPA